VEAVAFASRFILTLATLVVVASPAHAASGDCAQPESDTARPTATDCLRILRVAVGLSTCDPLPACVCAPGGELPAKATDALICLVSAIGGPATLDCPCTTTTSTTSTSTSTTTLPPECVVDEDCRDLDVCNGFERCTSGNCEAGTPLACEPADAAFFVPYQHDPFPATLTAAQSAKAPALDVYLLVDRSGSMAQERAALQSGVQAALETLACEPAGVGTLPDCVASLWVGVGGIGYAGVGGEPYTNTLDVQPELSAIAGQIPADEPAGCCAESTLLALWSTISGQGSGGSGCSVGDAYAPRASCATSPAGVGGVGYPCFRPDALKALLVLTDEAPSAGLDCPPPTTVASVAADVDARVIGVYGSGTTPGAIAELENLATLTGALTADQGLPIVVDGSAAGAASAVSAALSELVDNGVYSNVTAYLVDDADDAVDTESAFVERIETVQLGTEACPSGLIDVDNNGDSYPDTFVGVKSGQAFCFRLVLRVNETVAEQESTQLYRATMVMATLSGTVISEFRILFAVPAAP
jgi:hypothetical protein